MRQGALLITVGVVLAVASVAQAATYRVTKRGDHAPDGCSPADCTLREATLAANATIGVADRVVLPSRKPYRLAVPGGLEDEGATGDFDINDPLEIVHRGKGRATVSGAMLDRVFDAYDSITVRKLVITRGKALRYGGAIRAEARVSVVDSVIKRNESGSCGGGIHTHHRFPLRIIRSSVLGNKSAQGGGVSNSCFGTGGPLTMIRSTIAHNRGGIDSFGDFIPSGGGMYFKTAPRFLSTIKNSTFAGNSTGPTSDDDADGGGLYTDLGGLRVTGSTFSHNRAGDAGGAIAVHDSEPLRLTDTTISGNRARGNGGGIDFVSGEASLNAVTVVRNVGNSDGTPPGRGGGILYGDGLSIENSLVGLNRLGRPGGGSTRNDCAGEAAIDSAGHNLFSNLSLCELDGPGDFVRGNPKLGKLARNGGPTKTVALKKRSPAIGEAKRSTAPGKDQRGRKRDRRPDVGAFER